MLYAEQDSVSGLLISDRSGLLMSSDHCPDGCVRPVSFQDVRASMTDEVPADSASAFCPSENCEEKNMKFIISASLIIAVLSLIGIAGAADISFDTSGIPENAAEGDTYTIPVTISGDVTGFTFLVSYGEDAADVSFSNTGSTAQTGGRDGSRSIMNYGGPCTFNVDVKVQSGGPLKLRFVDIYHSDGSTEKDDRNSVIVDLNVSSGSGSSSGSFISRPSAASQETVRPTPAKPTPAKPTPVKQDTDTAAPASSENETVSQSPAPLNTGSEATSAAGETQNEKTTEKKNSPTAGAAGILGALAIAGIVSKYMKKE